MISKNKLLTFIGLWWLIFIATFSFKFSYFQINNFFAVTSILFIPGFLTLLLFKLDNIPSYVFVPLAVALSLLELMVLGFLCNTFLPLIGIAQPLAPIYLLEEITLLIIFKIFLIFFNRQPSSSSTASISLSPLFLVPVVLVVSSIFGAISLNNGGSNFFTLLMIGLAVIWLSYLYYRAAQLPGNLIPWSLYLLALSLLLMTSLRGWLTTGHDIQLETKVFELTKNANLWSMSTYVDAYNACLSITILPTIISRLSTVPDVLVFKLIFQLIFALIAPVIYSISRRYLNPRLSLLSTIFFVGFPTFFEDMPFLIRQEVAFLFYSLMIYFVVASDISLSLRRKLILILGIGVILSHYSTTYTVLFVLVVASVASHLFSFVRSRIDQPKILKQTAITTDPSVITIPMVVVLILLNLLWTSTITDTGSNLSIVLSQTLKAAQNGFSENSRSIDAVSLFSFKRIQESQRMMNYVIDHVNTRRLLDARKEYIDENPYPLNMDVNLIPDKKLPPTALSKYLQGHGFHTNFLIPFVGQALSRIIQLSMVIGIIYVLFRRKNITNVSFELYFLGIASLLFIALNILLPVLSTEYGVFRAILQSLVIISLFMVVGLLWLTGFLSSKPQQIVLFVVTLTYLLYTTNFIPQLFGNNNPQLYLNNTGNYYDNYLTHQSEADGIVWLRSATTRYTQMHLGQTPEVQADNFSQNKIKASTKIGLSENIFPRLVKKGSFVFLGYTNVVKSQATVKYNGDSLKYFFDISFFDNNKDLLYNNSQVRIYK